VRRQSPLAASSYLRVVLETLRVPYLSHRVHQVDLIAARCAFKPATRLLVAPVQFACRAAMETPVVQLLWQVAAHHTSLVVCIFGLATRSMALATLP